VSPWAPLVTAEGLEADLAESRRLVNESKATLVEPARILRGSGGTGCPDEQSERTTSPHAVQHRQHTPGPDADTCPRRSSCLIPSDGGNRGTHGQPRRRRNPEVLRDLLRRGYLMTTPLRKNQIQQGRVHSVGVAACGAFHAGVAMTDSRWELTIVTLVTITVFFSVWHVVEPLIH
jgi:hypothetical protein